MPTGLEFSAVVRHGETGGWEGVQQILFGSILYNKKLPLGGGDRVVAEHLVIKNL